MGVMNSLTMLEKLWSAHAVSEEYGESLLYVDRVLFHEASSHTFAKIRQQGLSVFRPEQNFGFSDHYVPTAGREKGIKGIAVPEIRNMVQQLEDNTARHGIRLFGIDDPQQGILHVVPPELGITQPGLFMVGTDSHTPTHGGFGCLALSVAASDLLQVMVTQALWLRKPKTMRVTIDGVLGFGVVAKDVILALIAKIGAGGAAGHLIEYAGSTIRAMSMESRMTVSNMSTEAGGRGGMIAPDHTTFAYLEGRPYAPSGAEWSDALALWKTLPSDADARFDREVNLDASQLAPMVTWGTSPEHALPITGHVPDPSDAGNDEKRAEVQGALDYMSLAPGAALADIQVDRVFIGSCTNSRIEDLRAAAEVARLGHARIPAWVVPGSREVRRQAEAEGLDRVFTAAGFEWREPGCSMCTALNGDQLQPGERCVSTSNRNFRGRQGPGGRTHLASPAMAAAAAITGRLTDVRELARKG